jgi:hyperosmotically inducible protein
MRNIRAISHSMLASAMSIGLLFAAGSTMAAGQSAQSAEREEQRTDSAQPGTDAWITAKVKGELALADDVSATKINVDTTNGVVTLKGRVGSKAEADKAVEVAKRVDGVKKVDKSGLTVGKD